MRGSLIAGDSLNFFTEVVDRLPGDGYVLKYRMVPVSGGTPITFSAVTDGAGYRVILTSAITAGWISGEYAWTSYVERGAERYTVEQGRTEISPDPVAATIAYDPRPLAERTLADLRKALANFDPMTKSYKIADRERVFSSTAEILQLIKYWENESERDKVASGAMRPGSRFIHTRI
jgi:hypothetical protein